MPVIGGARALVVAAATAAVALAGLDLPAKFWEDQALLLYGGVAVLGVTTLQQSMQSVASLTQAGRVRIYEQEIRDALSNTLFTIATEKSVPWDKVGVHAFRSQGFWIFKRLVNVGGLRLGAKPSMAWPAWKPGKGLIGRAWDLQACVAEDWASFFASKSASGRAMWDALPRRDRFGLSWGELQLTGDYQGIVACPIFAGEKIIGCVSIDAPLTVADLLAPRMQEIMRDLAVAVRGVGDPPRAWWSYRGP